MLFNSFSFLLFLPTVMLLYFLLPHRFRWMLLLAASCLFYMAFIPVYILILFVTILIDYFAALRIEATRGRSRKLLSAAQMVYCVAGIVTLCVFEILQGHRRIGAALRPERILQRWGMYVSLTIGILLIGVFDGGQFIYFQL